MEMKSEPFGPSYKRVSHPIVRILSSPYFKLVDALEMHSAFYLGDIIVTEGLICISTAT